jgi:alpha-amylase
MMGEVFDNGVERDAYHEQGFDTLLNFELQPALQSNAPLDPLYVRYAKAVGGNLPHFVSYLSSHDTYLFDRRELRRGALALMLAPGGVLLLYGDESGRAPAPSDWPGAADHGTRTDMNWDSLDTDMLEWWRMLGQFRARHVALARGGHRCLNASPYAFLRFDRASGDIVLIVLDCQDGLQLDVAGIFSDGARLRCAASGISLCVRDEMLDLPQAEVLLIERSS